MYGFEIIMNRVHRGILRQALPVVKSEQSMLKASALSVFTLRKVSHLGAHLWTAD